MENIGSTGIKRGDVFWADLGFRDPESTESHIQTGYRPVVVVQNNTGCFFSETLSVIPLTARLKKLNQPTHYILKHTPFLKRKSMAIAEQVVTVNKRQLSGYLGSLSTEDMEGVDTALKIQLGILNEEGGA